MFGCETVFIDCLNVRFGAVANMLVEAVFWIFFGEFNHVVVTSNFSNNGCSGDFTDFIVALNASGGEFF